jgi:DNA-binding MarR family transcriptional regulator
MSRSELVEAFQNFSFHMMQYREKVMIALDLSFMEMLIVTYLKKKGPAKLSDLATLAGLTKPTMTHLIDGLESRGFVKREQDRNDRRIIFVTTGKECDRMFTVFESINSDFMSAINDLDEKTADEVKRMVDRLAESLSKRVKEGLK